MKNKIIKNLFVLALAVLFLGAAHFALAQTDLGLNAAEQIGLSNTSPKTLIVNIVRVMLGFLALIMIIIIMYGGWLWMTAGGEAEKVDKAKKLIRNAVIGLIILLSAFAIVSFIITKLVPPCEGPNCGNPPVCDPPCAEGLTCCPGDYCAESCGTPPPEGVFAVKGTIPRNQSTNVIRNVVVQAFFNQQIDNQTTQETLDNNFKVEQIGTVADNGKTFPLFSPKLIALTALAQTGGIMGSVATSSAWEEINFTAAAECGDEASTTHCFPAKSQIRVTINGGSGIISSVGRKSLSCAAGATCVFTFATGELIDTGPPTAGIIPAQICKDDGTLKPDANTVGGWGRDDIAMGSLIFYSQKTGGSEEMNHLEPGNEERYQYLDWKYDTTNYSIGDEYTFKVLAKDMAAATSTASFITNVKPGHCCNGIKDADEEDIDCGGADCLACEGGACNRTGVNQCGASNSNCADELCSTSFCQCTTDACICKKRPIINKITPTGGFCDGNINKFCQVDGDCAGLSPATCNKDTANGAPNNFLTIFGKNFGVVSNLLENVLTNVNFEQGTLGGVPKDWRAAKQNHSWIGIVSEPGNYVSPERSVKMHEDAGQPYPGVCGEELCRRQGIYDKFPFACEWRNEDGVNKCVFPHNAYCGEGECKVNEGSNLRWPYTNRVMWNALTYDISKLNFKVGDKYVLRFKYKGRTQKNISIAAGYSLGNTVQAWKKSDYGNDSNCVELGGSYCSNSPGKCQCSGAPDYCCYHAPLQTKPYIGFNFLTIRAGDYKDWQSYESYFIYTAEMDRLRDKTGKKVIEVGLAGNYYATDSQGSDIYIDDFQFARVASNAGVKFVGVKDDASDDRMGIFPTDLNPACISSWTDRQIIIAVPGSTVSGSINVTGENGLTDATDDPYGPMIKDFTANTIVRPGICRLANNKCSGDPLCEEDHGLIGDTLTYYGLNLPTGAIAYFGDWWGNKVQGGNSAFGANSNKQGTADVANIYPGLTTSFVVKGKVGSNYLNFTKDEEPYAGPQILSFDPTRGPIGQYVTIRGRKFGNAQGTSKVFFGPVSGKEASYSFPEVCKDSVWKDNQVIVKVPEDLANGYYTLTMQIGSQTIDSSGLATPKFKVDSTLPLSPSLCKIDPQMGPVGSDVSFWGEYFGTKDINSKARFHLNKNQEGEAISYWGAAPSTPSGIVPDKALTTVPKAASTGPARLVKNSPELAGNGLNFKVGECSKDDECGGTNVCCPTDSPAKGRCLENIDKCYAQFNSCVYEWDINTGEPEFCDGDAATPGCQKDQSRCVNGKICDESDCRCKIPCSKSGMTGVCMPDQNKCPADTTCNRITCLCNPGPEPKSCSGYALVQCVDSLYCPNSPGNCSANQNPFEATACTDDYCTTELCNGEACLYHTDLNKCIRSGNLACDLNQTIIKNYNGQDYTFEKFCAKYNGNTYFEYKGNGNCAILGSSFINIGQGLCVSETAAEVCDFCAGNFKCVDELGKIDGNSSDYIGVCGLSGDVCANGFECANGVCIQETPGYCECCCDINSNYEPGNANYPGNPACCTPLICGNDCGSGGIDKSNPLNGNYSDSGDVDFGLCSGCANIGTNQDDHDRACNCEGTTGKYCDMTNSEETGGVCRDCTSLTFISPSKCSEHSASCCVDAKKSNSCSGQAGNKEIIKGDTPDLAYCSYYNCQTSGKYQCASSTPTIDGQYGNARCDNQCGQCVGCSCFDRDTDNCSLTCDHPDTYQCFGDTGNSGCYDNAPLPPRPACSAGDESCICCCDPYNTGSDPELDNYDKCKKIIDPIREISGKLSCKADKRPCTTNKRGLCCGCVEDSNCGSPNNVGCSSDSCCRSRPTVISTIPTDGMINVCRNAEISATFDQKMDVNSLPSNMILAGEYDSACPAGTTPLAKGAAPKGFFSRLATGITDFIKRIVRVKTKTAAADVPNPEKNYCTASTTVMIYNNQVIFRIGKLLDSERKYFAILKGDPNLNDDIKEGVLSTWKVGMNGPDNMTFNGVEFKHAKVWSFTTKPDTAPNKGLCTIDKAYVEPYSYLFQTVKNSITEVDTDRSDLTYDTEKDSDKEYRSFAVSDDNQILSPVAGYYWNWVWKIDNTLVAATTTRPINEFLSDPANRFTEFELIAAQEDITEGETKAHAVVKLSESSLSSEGDGKEGVGDIYVFVCENPWPALNSDKTWSPWKDTRRCEDSAGKSIGFCPAGAAVDESCVLGQGTCKENCTITDQGCFYTNQEIYYCRDKGAKGDPADDLPKIFGDAIRGSSTIQDVFKEFYFLRHK
ncbi:MAG: Ig-like domain-containing protein [Patescibacteria group bacterium]|jgi:hypothetical protein